MPLKARDAPVPEETGDEGEPTTGRSGHLFRISGAVHSLSDADRVGMPWGGGGHPPRALGWRILQPYCPWKTRLGAIDKGEWSTIVDNNALIPKPMASLAGSALDFWSLTIAAGLPPTRDGSNWGGGCPSLPPPSPPLL